MKKHLFVLLAVVSLLLAGCIHLPSIGSSKPSSSHVSLPGSVTPGVPYKVDNRVVTSSPTKNAIQTAVNWQATLCVIGGLAALGFGAFLIYSGHILAGVKMVAVGVLLPIFGIWFAYHWLLVVILTLCGFAAYWLCLHYGVVQPLLDKIESAAKNDAGKITHFAKAYVPPPAPAAPVPPATLTSKA